MQRLLYVWAIRHPASGYVQGVNELATPFVAVYQGSEGCEAEADSYWSLTLFVDQVQDLFTAEQPGVQRMLYRLREHVARVDGQLHGHLEALGVPYLHMFRWMNCLLLRELPLALALRLWDTYLAHGHFAALHVYVCAAVLVRWSEALLQRDEQEVLLFLQALPTQDWTERDLEPLLAQAYVWLTLYN